MEESKANVDTVAIAENEIIFEAERVRNLLEIKRDDLKGLAILIKKKELDSKIDRRNEEIDILKAGLSSIVKKHGFRTVQEFYTAFKTSQNAFYRYQEEADRQNSERTYKNRDKGAR